MVNEAPPLSITIDQLSIGQNASMEKEITEKDVLDFARISGDTNPIHVNEDFAKNTPFKTRIVHGILTASHISSIVANQLPGQGTVYLGQTLKFLRPVPLNSTVVTEVSIKEINIDKNTAILDCVCKVKNKRVLIGEATILCPKKSETPT